MPTQLTELESARELGESPQPRQLIVTVYGLYARERGGRLSVASVVRMLGALGVDEQAVRSSISRLKRRGILDGSKVDGVAGYALSRPALEILREGDVRIFHRRRATRADGWVLAVFSVPESERGKRHTLRSQLTWLGFGTAAPGVWIAPGHLYEETAEVLRRTELTPYVDLFRGDHLGFGDLQAKIPTWWDLDLLQRLYDEFLDRYTPIRARWTAQRGPAAAEAFADYVLMLTTWRRLPYLDPGLPLELLPDNWHGVRAAELFDDLRARLHAPAHAYAWQLIEG